MPVGVLLTNMLPPLFQGCREGEGAGGQNTRGLANISSDNELADKNKLVSPANNVNCNKDEQLTILLIYNKKSNCPRIEPCEIL